MISSNIRRLRKEKKISQQELADALNVHQTAISQWENGRTRPDQTLLLAIAAYFNVSIDSLLDSNESVVHQNRRRIPVFGNIPAGIPNEAIEEIIDYEDLPDDLLHSGHMYFAIKIHGDSMSPAYIDGDVVIFLSQDTCDSGDDCAVLIDGNNSTFKRVRRSQYGITLQPLNPEYEPLVFSNEEIESLPVRIIGVAKEIRRRIH